MDRVYSRNPDVVFRMVAGECILVPVRKSIGEMDSIYALNEVAASAWNLLDGARSLVAIASALAGEYEADALTIEADLSALFRTLDDAGLIIAGAGEAA